MFEIIVFWIYWAKQNITIILSFFFPVFLWPLNNFKWHSWLELFQLDKALWEPQATSFSYIIFVNLKTFVLNMANV